jgi:nucleoside-diphosphate-sugar epimerase
MQRALIGYTGFVGSNISRQTNFDCMYNSKNIETMANSDTFEIVVCAAPHSMKWRANKYPEEDLISLNKLINVLGTIQTRKLILISTIDVYPEARMVIEDTPIILENLTPYSKHRRLMELFVENRFDALVVRLPGLFGTGLCKNYIYDLLHNQRTFVHQDGIMQYYNLDNIWRDINIALKNNIKIINISSEPTTVKEVAKEAFSVEFDNNLLTPPPVYDMHTKHALFWNRKSVYLYDKKVILSDIRNFVVEMRKIKDSA